MVVSRLWPTTTLTPAILTGGLAAPAAALALPPAGEQSSNEQPSPAEPSPPIDESQPPTEASPPTNESGPPAEPPPPVTQPPPPVTQPPPPVAQAPPPSSEAQQSNTAPPQSPASPPPASEPAPDASTTEPGETPPPRAPGAVQAITAQPIGHGDAAHTPIEGRRGTIGKRSVDRRRPSVAPDVDAPSFEAGAFGIAAPVPVPAGLTGGLTQPPAFLIDIYKQAGGLYHVPWRVLAAINAIETDYGSDLSVSSQGAMGWMQFMPDTWRLYGDGGNPYDPHDAIFAAARLLAAAGASHDLPGAVFAYNHADWYVAAVLWRASTIDIPSPRVERSGYSLPLDAPYMRQLGRTDDGVDIETAPDGAPVYSITPGVVVAVAGDPAGFGPNYPVILVTAGPLAGNYVYYGHVAASLVLPGQRVSAGEPIAIVGHTGDAADLGHGHIEIGFCDSSGNPLDHHGVEAWTPAGQAMRWVLESLSSRFEIASP